MNHHDVKFEAVANRLWHVAEATCGAAPATPVVIDALLQRLEDGLRRWIGAEGYAALLSRAVAHLVPAHPALSSIADLGVNAHDADAATPGDDDTQRIAVIALLCTMMQQLGGIIGETMAIRLFEQTVTPSQRGTAGLESNETPS